MAGAPPVVCFASVDWAFNRQIPQGIAIGLAAAGHRVLYIENTGVRSVGWGDAGRMASRLANWWRGRRRLHEVTPGVDVLSPLLLPLPYSSLACRLNAAALTRGVRAWLATAAPDAPVVYLTFLPTPLSAAVGSALAPAVEVYYCTDNFAASSPGARAIARHEDALLARADVVLTTSTGLQRAAQTRTPRAVLLPAAVECDRFEEAADAARVDWLRLPPALQALRRPIAGIVGSVREASDLPLLAAAARLAPDVTFVFAGPVMTDVSVLRACPNVVLTGAMPHDAIIEWMAGFDVGLAAYVHTPFTEDVMPLKIKEYLAAGLAVVATGLPELRHFGSLHPSLIAFADSPEAFVAAIRAGIADRSAAAVAARRAAAREYDLSCQLARFRAMLDAAIALRRMGAVT